MVVELLYPIRLQGSLHEFAIMAGNMRPHREHRCRMYFYFYSRTRSIE